MQNMLMLQKVKGDFLMHIENTPKQQGFFAEFHEN